MQVGIDMLSLQIFDLTIFNTPFFDIKILTILFITALVAGFIDAIAGGGGLITIPALMLTNMPIVSVLATNKLQASAGSLSASVAMIKKRLTHPKHLILALVMAFVGAVFGTVLVQLSPPDFLKIVIPILIAIIGLYTLFMPNISNPQKPKISQKTWQTKVVPIIGFYDGYFGPATGTFFFAWGSITFRHRFGACHRQRQIDEFCHQHRIAWVFYARRSYCLAGGFCDDDWTNYWGVYGGLCRHQRRYKNYPSDCGINVLFDDN